MRSAALLVYTALVLLTGCAASERVPPCFPGAIYRKAVSPVGNYTGIEAVVQLPEFTPDPARINPKNNRPLDNTSAYLGGHANGREIDAGLTWEVIRDAKGQVSADRVAFRPFWRNDVWANAPAQPEYYYFPGDKVLLRCELIADEEMLLTVELQERAAGSRKRCEELGIAYHDAPTRFTAVFEAPEFRINGRAEFKRVNAIDQSGNEGFAAQATAAVATGIEWHQVNLLRGEARIPFTPDLYMSMRCPNVDNVVTAPIPGSTDPTAETNQVLGSESALFKEGRP
jgi:hypothetical protein